MTYRGEAYKNIKAALTTEFESAKQLYARIGCWAPQTVRHNLNILCHEGYAEREIRPHASDTVISFYRRRAA